MGALCLDDEDVGDVGEGCEKPLPSQGQSLKLDETVLSCPLNSHVISDAYAVTVGRPSAALPTAVGQTSYDLLLAEPGLKETGQTESH